MYKKLVSVILCLSLVFGSAVLAAAADVVVTGDIMANDYIGVLADKMFSIGTPEGITLLYEYPNKASSYGTIRVDGGIAPFYLISPMGDNSFDPDTNTISRKATWQGIEITQSFRFIASPETGNEDLVEVKYTYRNRTNTSHSVAHRTMLDVDVNNRDFAPFRIDSEVFTKGRVYEGNDIPYTWQALDKIIDPGLVAYGRLRGTGNDPDIVQFGRYQGMSETPWSYAVDPEAENDDSAVAVKWLPKPLAPGESRSFVTYYGIGDTTRSTGEALGLTVKGAKNAVISGETYEPYIITATVENIDYIPVDHVYVELSLPTQPAGMNLAEGESLRIDIGALAPGDSAEVTWNVIFEPQTDKQVFPYKVEAGINDVKDTSITRSVTVPPIGKSLVAITVSKPPDVMNYFLGEDAPILDLTGIEVTAYYTDNSSRDLGYDEWRSSLINGDDLSEIDIDDDWLIPIVITYKEAGVKVTTSFNIGLWTIGVNVPSDKTLICIIVTALPRWVYAHGDEFDTTDMVVTACFFDPQAEDTQTSTEIVTDDCEVDPEHGAPMLQLGIVAIGVSYSREEGDGINTKDTTFNVLVNPAAPTVRTDPVSDISSSGAVFAGEVISDGGSDVTERGFIYSTNPEPEPELSSGTRVIVEPESEEFTSAVTGLASSTTYYVRAYAINNVGVSFGEDVSFTTSAGVVPTGGPTISAAIGEIEVPLAEFEGDHIIYINGYPDGTVEPDGAVTRAEVAMIFYRLLDTEDTAPGGNFSDVPDGSWYSDAVNYLASLEIINGYPDGTFKPGALMTRAEFAAIATRFGEAETADTNAFDDVPSDHWAVTYINSALAMGWINGYPDGTFKPGNNISRAEVVTIVNAMLSRTIDADALAEVINPFSDLSPSHWAYADIIEASVPHDYDRDEEGTEFWTDW